MRFLMLLLLIVSSAQAEQVSRGMSRVQVQGIIGQPVSESTDNNRLYLFFNDAKICLGEGRCVVTLNEKDQVLFCDNFNPKYLSDCEVPAPVVYENPALGEKHIAGWRKVLHGVGHVMAGMGQGIQNSQQASSDVHCTSQVVGNTVFTNCN